MRSFKRQVSVATILIATAMAGPSLGQVHTESGDADMYWEFAQEVDAADAIEGNLGSIAPLNGTDVDMYRVCLAGNQTFSASTYIEDGGSSTGIDAVLMLFDSEGRAIYYNDNIASDVNDARLPAGHTLTPTIGGVYYLAITKAGGFAVGVDGKQMFDQPEIGVGGAISGYSQSGWQLSPVAFGDYRIVLTGLTPCSTPPIYTVSDFLPPINPGAVNTVKAGGTVAIKWLLTDGNGNPVDDPSSFVAITSDPGGGICAGLPGEVVESTAGASGLQYLGGGVWQFNWKTSKNYAGQCRLMTLTLSDGTEASAVFRFH